MWTSGVDWSCFALFCTPDTTIFSLADPGSVRRKTSSDSAGVGGNLGFRLVGSVRENAACLSSSHVRRAALHFLARCRTDGRHPVIHFISIHQKPTLRRFQSCSLIFNRFILEATSSREERGSGADRMKATEMECRREKEKRGTTYEAA